MCWLVSQGESIDVVGDEERTQADTPNSMQLFNVTGIMISYFVNYGINRQITDPANSAVWRIPFALQMLPGLLLLLIAWQNESPRWLIEKNRISEARHALAHVRGVPEDDRALQEELEEIVADFEGKEQLSLGMQVKAACSSKQMFYQSSIGVVLMFWQQWTGTNSINYYSPQIFESVGLSSASAGLFATGIYGVVKVVFTALTLMFGVEQAGRKVSFSPIHPSSAADDMVHPSARSRLTFGPSSSGLSSSVPPARPLPCSTLALTNASTPTTRRCLGATSSPSSASTYLWSFTHSAGVLYPMLFRRKSRPTTVRIHLSALPSSWTPSPPLLTP